MNANTTKTMAEHFNEIIEYAKTASAADLTPAGRGLVLDRLKDIQREFMAGDTLTFKEMARDHRGGQDAWGVLCDFGLLDE